MTKKVKEGCECKDEVKESSSMKENKKILEEMRARRERVEQVQELLSSVHYKTEEEKDAAIISFTKANLTIEEIESLTTPLRADYLGSKNAQVHRKGMF